MDILSEEEILERVDEYTLYSFYLEFEPEIGQKYSSPLRDGDEKFSFGIFKRKYGSNSLPNEFMWKDNGMIAPNFGDIFFFVQKMYGLSTRFEAVLKILADHGLGGEFEAGKVLVKTPRFKKPAEIRIKSRDFNYVDLAYWRQYNVTPEILARYNTTAVDYYYLSADQAEPFHPKQMYAYRIFNKYQLYSPFPKYFTNDWTDLCIPGFQQLKGSDLLILTKSMKDIMCLSSFGFETMAPKAENSIPKHEFIEFCKTKYKRVVTLFDNDGKTSEHLYPFEHFQIPIESGEKDPSDYCARYGPKDTLKLLNNLLCL